MAKYFREPPSLAQFENTPTRSPGPGLAAGSSPAASTPAPQDAPRKKGIRERSPAESWARGLLVMAAGLGLFALLNTASAILLETGAGRPLLAWAGAGLVALAGREAGAALITDPSSSGPWYRPGGWLLVAGLVCVFAGPWLLGALS